MFYLLIFSVIVTVVPVPDPIAGKMFDVTSSSSEEAVVVDLFEPFDETVGGVLSS